MGNRVVYITPACLSEPENWSESLRCDEVTRTSTERRQLAWQDDRLPRDVNPMPAPNNSTLRDVLRTYRLPARVAVSHACPCSHAGTDNRKRYLTFPIYFAPGWKHNRGERARGQ